MVLICWSNHPPAQDLYSESLIFLKAWSEY